MVENLWARVDAELRRRRGGYFTPQPIVQFIVRSVDRILRHDLDVAGGLAAHDVPLRIVDPACGSGAFLLGVIEQVRESCRQTGGEPQWQRIARHMLPQRLVGVDVLPACCGAAEMLVESQLGTCWSAHCGNLLEDVEYAQSLFADGVPIIVGNPPYANFGRRNRGAWIREQLATYKAGLREKKHNLADDFIKFLRWGQYWIDQAGWGVLAMVTNNTYLDGLTHRQMRASLAATFDRMDVLDLHGNRKKRERTPAGVLDENVFGIQQGVAIGVFVKCRPRGERVHGRTRHAELWGSKQEKLNVLADADPARLPWQELPRRGPGHYFVPVRGARGRHLSPIAALGRDLRAAHFGCPDKVGCAVRGVHAGRSGAAHAGLPGGRGAGTISCECSRVVARENGRCVLCLAADPTLHGRAVGCAVDLLRTEIAGTRAVWPAAPSGGRQRGTGLHATGHPQRELRSLPGHAHAGLRSRVLQRARRSLRGPVVHRSRGPARDQLAAEFLAESGGPSGSGLGRSRDRIAVVRIQRRLSLDVCRAAQLVVSHTLSAATGPRFSAPSLAGRRGLLSRPGTPGQGTGRDPLPSGGRRRADQAADEALMPGLPHVAVASGYPRWTAPATLFLDRGQAWPEPVEEAVWQFRIGGYAVLPRWLKQRQRRVLTDDDQRHLQRMIQAIRATLDRTRAIDQIT